MAVALARIVYLATELLKSVEDGICLQENSHVTDLHHQVEIGLRELLGYAEGPQNTIPEQMDCTFCACKDLVDHLKVLGYEWMSDQTLFADTEAAFKECKGEEKLAAPDGRVALEDGVYMLRERAAFAWFPTNEAALEFIRNSPSEIYTSWAPMHMLQINMMHWPSPLTAYDFAPLREAYYLNSPGGDW